MNRTHILLHAGPKDAPHTWLAPLARMFVADDRYGGAVVVLVGDSVQIPVHETLAEIAAMLAPPDAWEVDSSVEIDTDPPNGFSALGPWEPWQVVATPATEHIRPFLVVYYRRPLRKLATP